MTLARQLLSAHFLFEPCPLGLSAQAELLLSSVSLGCLPLSPLPAPVGCRLCDQQRNRSWGSGLFFHIACFPATAFFLVWKKSFHDNQVANIRSSPADLLASQMISWILC